MRKHTTQYVVRTLTKRFDQESHSCFATLVREGVAVGYEPYSISALLHIFFDLIFGPFCPLFTPTFLGHRHTFVLLIILLAFPVRDTLLQGNVQVHADVSQTGPCTGFLRQIIIGTALFLISSHPHHYALH
jgi:hypothetical protein